jgi:hypothetical protein
VWLDERPDEADGRQADTRAITARAGARSLRVGFMGVLNVGVLGVEAIAGDDNEIALRGDCKLTDLE